MLKKLITVLGLFVCVLGTAYAAPRNLLTEYRTALENLDSRKAKSLLDDGVVVSDAVTETFSAMKGQLKDHTTHTLLEGTIGRMTKALENFSEYMEGSDGGYIKITKVSAKDVQSYKDILQALRAHGGKLYQDKEADVLFSRKMPIELFEMMLSVWDKRPMVFTGSEVGSFLLFPRNFELSVVGLKKLNALIQYGAKIDKSESSDGIFSNLIQASLSDSMLNNMKRDSYLRDSDVEYLKIAFNLLEKLGANPGPKSRHFWQVLGTKTPWEVLQEYRNSHKNEPELVKRANEIERLLPAPEA